MPGCSGTVNARKERAKAGTRRNTVSVRPAAFHENCMARKNLLADATHCSITGMGSISPAW